MKVLFILLRICNHTYFGIVYPLKQDCICSVWLVMYFTDNTDFFLSELKEKKERKKKASCTLDLQFDWKSYKE